MDIEEIEKMERVDIGPGDTLVVSCDCQLTAEQQDRIRNEVQAYFPNVNCMVIGRGTSIKIIHNTDEA